MSRLFLVLLMLVALVTVPVLGQDDAGLLEMEVGVDAQQQLEAEAEQFIAASNPELEAELDQEADEFASSIFAEIDEEALLETESESEGEEAQEEVAEVEAEQEAAQDEEINNFLEMGTEAGDSPSYTLPYPAITYASHAAGGFFHPFSNVNPLGAPWAGFAPTALPATYPVSSAAIAASPLSYYNSALGVGGVHPGYLGVHPATYAGVLNNGKGGYNVHGLAQYGVYHPGFNADIASLGGKAGGTDGKPAGGDGGDGGDDGFLEMNQGQMNSAQSMANGMPLASESHDPANIDADGDKVAYGLFPAPTPESTTHFVRSNTLAMLGPHKLNFEPVGDNEIDDVWPAFVETTSEAAPSLEAADGCVNCSFD